MSRSPAKATPKSPARAKEQHDRIIAHFGNRVKAAREAEIGNRLSGLIGDTISAVIAVACRESHKLKHALVESVPT